LRGEPERAPVHSKSPQRFGGRQRCGFFSEAINENQWRLTVVVKLTDLDRERFCFWERLEPARITERNAEPALAVGEIAVGLAGCFFSGGENLAAGHLLISSSMHTYCTILALVSRTICTNPALRRK
jgi:hypothetical protein